MKKILIGTHNKGKFKEIAYLLSKKFKKISPAELKIKSPKDTGKSFISNSKVKVRYSTNMMKRLKFIEILKVKLILFGYNLDLTALSLLSPAISSYPLPSCLTKTG